MEKAASLSIVLPCYNEEDVLLETHNTIKNLSDKWRSEGLIGSYELIFVNDGSTDKTLQIMMKIIDADPAVVVIDLRKNVGFQGAISAGLFSASKEMVVSIDADLQDDPAKIEDMIRKYYDGYEMVLGVRENRDSDSFLKRITAQYYYKLLELLGVKAVFNHGDFRLLSRSIVEELKKFPERVRYLRSLIFEVESRYACVYYKRAPRKFGKSKFNLSKMFSFAIDGITSFSSAPIRVLSLIGVGMFVFSVAGSLIAIYIKFFLKGYVPGWASLLIVVLFFGGIQNLFLGIMGEYISKLYLEIKQRPLYLIRKTYRRDNDLIQ